MTSAFVVAVREARALLASANVEAGEAAVARRLTRELDQVLARLEARDADKDLVSIVCHDLKDPLASVVMGAGFLRKTVAADDTSARRVIEAIARSADRMSQVVGDFHDLAKLEAGSLSVDLQPCDVVAALQGPLSALQKQAEAKQLAFESPAPAAGLTARCDRGRLVQIVSKLVGNAIKFTPAGGRVSVNVSRDSNGVRVSVSDTGPGIAPERIPSIFDHAANARRTPRDGPGLGLAIARGLAELQGGSVNVSSHLGEGSTFVLTLPSA